MDLSPRYVATAVALLALVPVMAFIVLNSELLAIVALVNVVLIATSLAIAFSPIAGGHGDHENGQGEVNGA